MQLTNVKFLEEAHEDSIWAAVWASGSEIDKKILITSSVDETVKYWEGDDLHSIRTDDGNTLGVISMAVDPTGTIVAQNSMDSKIRVCDVSTNETKTVLDSEPAESWGVAFNWEGTYLAVAGGRSGGIKVYIADTWKLHTVLKVPLVEEKAKKGENDFVLSVAWSSSGKTLACGCVDGRVAVFDFQRGNFLHFLRHHVGPVRALKFSIMEERILFTASDDTKILMYDAIGKDLICALQGHTEGVFTLDCTADGTAVVSGSGDWTVRLWDLSTRTSVQVLDNHKDNVWGVALSPPQPGTRVQRLATVGDDGSIGLFDFR